MFLGSDYRNYEGIITSCFVCFERREGYPLLETIIFGASLDKELAKHQNVVYIPHGTGYKLLDPDSIYDLLNWHEAERKHWKAELEGLLQADLSERQVGYT